MELSKRLKAVADLVTPGRKIADIGTDHAYIPIWLVEEERVMSAIAMDINKGPLAKAKENIEIHRLSDYIETRLSDGMKKLCPKEVDSVIIAGMGGGLVIKILEDVKERELGIREWILQPQSELRRVREYLHTSGYQVIAEDMVLDEGKFYPMMKVIQGEKESYREVEFCYGKLLLQQKHPVLELFLKKELTIKTAIYDSLLEDSKEGIRKRKEELKKEIELIQEALEEYAL